MCVCVCLFLYVELRGDNEPKKKRQQHKRQVRVTRGQLLPRGHACLARWSRAFCNSHVVGRGRGPGRGVTGVALTSKFCRIKFSNRTRQNFLKICQVVQHGES